MPRRETTRGQYSKEAFSLTSNGNKGPMFFFVAQRPLTKGAVLSAIGDTNIPGDVRNPVADLCTTSPLGRR